MPPASPPVPTVSLQSLFGRVLVAYRTEKNLDQAAMAERLGMSAANLSRIESGLANLTVEQLFYACQVLDIRPSELIRTAEDVWHVMEAEQGIRIMFTKMKQESTGRGYIEVAAEALREVIQPVLGHRYHSTASWWGSRPPVPDPEPHGG